MGCDCCGPPKEVPTAATEAPQELVASPADTLSIISNCCDDGPSGACGDDNSIQSTPPAIEECCADGNENDADRAVEVVSDKGKGEAEPIACKSACGATKEPEVTTSENPQVSSLGDTSKACCETGCDSDIPKLEADPTPPCCENKPSPCCDTSCLDRLALRECQTKCSTTQRNEGSKSSTKCCGSNEGEACNQHRRSTRERYGATLEALGCICRALLARGLESCCDTRSLTSVERRRCSKKSVQSSPRSSIDSCCTTGSKPTTNNLVKRGKQRASVRLSSMGSGNTSVFIEPVGITPEKDRGTSCNDGCCAPKKPMKEESCTKGCCSPKKPPKEDNCSKGCCSSKEPAKDEACAKGCCAPKEPMKEDPCGKGCCSPKPQPTEKVSCLDDCCSPEKAASRRNSCEDSCCDSKQAPGVFPVTEKVTAVTDLEKQLAGTEHVILSISGMTCTGCETKLNRTLATVPAVTNLKTSLILARAEFDLKLEAATAEDVIKHLERTTEFKCEKIAESGSSIDILVPSGQASLVDGTWPTGVIDMKLMGDGNIRVLFDPTIIGARDLLERGWSEPQTLAPPRPDPSLEAGSKHVRHLGYLTLLSAVLTIPVLVMTWAPLPEHEVAYSSASLALATIVQVVIAGPFYPKALKALVFSRVIEMDLLIVLSTSAAYIFSVIAFGFLMAGRPLERESFFETSTLLVTLIMVGRYVAALARQKAVESISIRSLQASTALLVNESKGSDREVDARLLQYGDVFKVAPDTKIPTDGTVMAGLSEVDESMLTGESRLVEKFPKLPVIAGSINGSGTLIVRLTRLPGDNTINAIAAMVDEAKLSKPKIQALADRVASYFVPVVVVLTMITFSIWVAIGMKVRQQSGSKAAVEAITYAITVLIVSCPCAIGLAVPMVVVIASGVAAKRGVVFKSADAIEVAYKASHVVFDKTGTLTTGKLSVADSKFPSGENEASPSLLLGLIDGIRHPVSIAVAAYLKARGIKAVGVVDPKSLPGRGVEATFQGKTLRAGNSRWLNMASHPIVEEILTEGRTAFCFVVDDALVAVFGLEDSPRPDASETVSHLQGKGVSVHVLSGDDDAAVQKVAAALGIPDAQARSRCSPADKQAYIQDLLHNAVPKKPVVIFCGDGTNDAVALAQATIGVHMNEGTDVAKSAADVVLMRPDLSGIYTMMNISRRAVNRIKFNFAWSFIYNLLAVLFATGALVTVSLPPEFAGLGELVSVLPVIAAAVLLRWSNI